jgi:antitoxin component of MazEF toxin-antitoxin module
MKSTIKKWGNSAAIRIPAAVMKAVEFDLDEIVDVREEAKRKGESSSNRYDKKPTICMRC